MEYENYLLKSVLKIRNPSQQEYYQILSMFTGVPMKMCTENMQSPICVPMKKYSEKYAICQRCSYEKVF